MTVTQFLFLLIKLSFSVFFFTLMYLLRLTKALSSNHAEWSVKRDSAIILPIDKILWNEEKNASLRFC